MLIIADTHAIVVLLILHYFMPLYNMTSVVVLFAYLIKYVEYLDKERIYKNFTKIVIHCHFNGFSQQKVGQNFVS